VRSASQALRFNVKTPLLNVSAWLHVYGTSEATQESHWNAWGKVLKSLVVLRQVIFCACTTMLDYLKLNLEAHPFLSLTCR